MSVATERRSFTRRWLGRAAYAAFLLIFVEISLQAWYRINAGAFLFERTAVPIFAKDALRGWSVQPDIDYLHVTDEFSARLVTNSQGFRVSPRRETFAEGKADGTFRVMLLGPSFAFGWAASYEDSVAGNLEQLLAKRLSTEGRVVEVVNAGVPSLPPANNLAWYRNVGASYQPDVIVQLIHANMLVGSRPGFWSQVEPPGYLVTANAGRALRWRLRLKQLGIVFYSWSAYVHLRGVFSTQAADTGSEPASGDALLDRRGVREAERFYRDLAQAGKDSGAAVLVVWFPPAYAVHPEDVGRWLHDGVWQTADLLAFHDRFCRHVDAEVAPCLNLYAPLARAGAGGERVYYRVDTHWTPLGNRAAAEAVVEEFVARGWIR